MQEDEYLSIETEALGLYKEKGSKFIAHAFPADTVDETKLQLESIKKQYHDARHHCYAYKIGKDNPEFRYNDDGEPSGTAGKPIFGQIESFGLTNINIIVIRYFGGIKLGTGGLIQAYRAAARNALEQSSIIKKTLFVTFGIHFPYLAMNDVMKTIKEENINIIEQIFTLEGDMKLSVRKGHFDEVREKFTGIEGVQLG